MKLRVLAGPSMGAIIDLAELPLAIGRDPASGLVLPIEGVSRHHARLIIEHGVYLIEDLDSTNGVRVNGQQIVGRKSLLVGDRIGISDAVLLFTDERSIAPLSAVDSHAETTTEGRAESTEPSKSWLNDPRIIVSSAVILLLLIGIAWLLMQGESKAPVTPQLPVVGELPVSPEPPAPELPRRPETPPSTRAATAPPATADQLTWYMVRTDPPGATILLDGEPQGTSPRMLAGMAPGRHELRLHLPGYEPATRYIFTAVGQPSAQGLGAAGATPVIPLRQQNTTCSVTSEPTGATVFIGPRMLGTTPLTISDLPPGDYRLRLVASGHEPGYLPIRLAAHEPTRAHGLLGTRTGTLLVTTHPADAVVHVASLPMGVTKAERQGQHDSAPLPIRNLAAGTYAISATWRGQQSPVQQVNINSADVTEVRLTIWMPTATVKLTDGREVVGMLRERRENGDLDISIAPTRRIIVPADRYDDVSIIPYDEYLRQQSTTGGD